MFEKIFDIIYNTYMRYLMIITYDGRAYSGWQRQKNADSIESRVESALETILREAITCTASGRTDAKVSAYFQPVHFETEQALDTKKVLHSMNGLLPDDIRVLSIVESDIHARFSAKKKTYLYKMYLSNIDLPLYSDALRISPDIDIKKMKRFIRLLKGAHDFIGFRASNTENDSTVRTIYKVKLYRVGLYLYFEITGNGFLYKMVRNIVGTMLKVGTRKLDLKELKSHLFLDYRSAHTAKPEYLYLLNVVYE